MSKADRGFGPGLARASVGAFLVGSLAIALAGCGGSDGSSSTGVSATSPFAASDTNSSGTTTSSTGSTTDTGTTGSEAITPPATAATSVSLAWQPPTQNSNGTPITDLAGYRIHYGTAS